MPDFIELRHHPEIPDDPEAKPRPSRITRLPDDGSRQGPLPNSAGFESKWLHEPDLVIGSRRRKVSLVERGVGESNVDSYIEKWRQFKKAGLPVVPYVYAADSSVFVKNVKHDGSEVFGFSYAFVSAGREGGLTNMERLFLRIMDNEFEQVSLKADQLVATANSSKMVLPYDDPFDLLVHPDQTWELIVLDLRNGKVRGNWGENYANVQRRLQTLTSLKDQLLRRPGFSEQ